MVKVNTFIDLKYLGNEIVKYWWLLLWERIGEGKAFIGDDFKVFGISWKVVLVIKRDNIGKGLGLGGREITRVILDMFSLRCF